MEFKVGQIYILFIIIIIDQIHVTDNGWTSTGFRGGEGVVTFTMSKSMPAGAVWVYEYGDTTTYTNDYGSWTSVSFSASQFISKSILSRYVTTLTFCVIFAIFQSSHFALSVTGDQVFVYTGTYDDPFFVYAASSTWSSTVSSTTSLLPDQLQGSNCYVTLGYDDNAMYFASHFGSKMELLDYISNISNWVTSSSERFDVHSLQSFSVVSPVHDDDDNKVTSRGVVLVVLCLLVVGIGCGFAMYLHIERSKNIAAGLQQQKQNDASEKVVVNEIYKQVEIN